MIHAPGVITINPDVVDGWMNKVQHQLYSTADRTDIVYGTFYPSRMVYIVRIFNNATVATTL
jgi:hypothetical protein